MVSAFALFLSYPVASLIWKLAGEKFDYGEIIAEAKPLLLAAFVDAVLTMMPISVAKLPAEYVAIGILPATVMIGYIYQRTHPEWSVARPYLFALVARFVLAVEIVAFMWSVSGVPV